jgi:hypothetical protein
MTSFRKAELAGEIELELTESHSVLFKNIEVGSSLYD